MDDPKKRGMGWVLWMTFATALPVIYIASVGPVAWLAHHDIIPEAFLDPIEMFYAPLAIATKSSRPFSDLIDWYIHICDG